MPALEPAPPGAAHPELAVAVVAVAFWLLAKARLPAPLTTFYNDSAELAAVTALALLVATAVKRAMRSRPALLGNAAGVVASLALIALVGTAVHLWQTHPGRSARAEASEGTAFDVAPAPASRVDGAADGASTGYADVGDTYKIHIDSEKTYSLSWLPSEPAGERFYAEVRARRLQGARLGNACTLDFLFNTDDAGVTRYHRMSLRDDGLLIVSNQDGSDRSRALAGPIDLPHVENLSVYHRLAVDRDGDRFRFFIDDRLVLALRQPPTPDGGVTFATLDIGFGYKSSATCEFDDFQAWRRD